MKGWSGFLMKVMERMVFHSKWSGWIYECISLVSFSIMVNGGANGSYCSN